MKTQFTATQQEILESLQNEFTKLNASKETTTKKGLVDWSKINGNVDAWNDKKYEVEKHNQAMYDIKYHLEQTIEQQLQDEFCMLNIDHGTSNWDVEKGCSKHIQNGTTWYIKGRKQYGCDYIVSIDLNYKRESIWSDCGNLYVHKAVGFYFSGYINKQSYRVDTFEQIFELPQFIDAMTKEMSR